MGKFSRLGHALYTGRKSVDFIGRWKLWYAMSAAVMLIAVVALIVRPLNFGIEFTGGAEYRVSLPSSSVTQTMADDVRRDLAATGVKAAASPVVTTSGDQAILAQTEPVTDAESAKIVASLLKTTGAKEADISQSEIGPSWGAEVAKRSLMGLGVFLVLVVLFIWAYFREWKMSIAAVVAVAHDVLITIGIYALTNFQVSPATVTGFLTILGFSLYDTVVVFDKVRENTHELKKSRMTYAAAANLAVNQTLVRSINTSIVALIPVGALLWAGVLLLGSGSLKDLALALFIGMACGAYSSIFIAPPLLVQLKSREKGVQEADRRALTRAKHDGAARSSRKKVGGTSIDEAGDVLVAERPPVGDGARASRAGSGRTAPASRKPVQPSAASGGRVQPSRKPRSQRGKK